MEPKLLTFNEVCKFLNINKGTLLKLISKGEIPAFRIGKLWRFDEGELIKWLNKQQNIIP